LGDPGTSTQQDDGEHHHPQQERAEHDAFRNPKQGGGDLSGNEGDTGVCPRAEHENDGDCQERGEPKGFPKAAAPDPGIAM
jgi:hypothetical protein